MKPRKKYIQIERTRHGKYTYYFRISGGARRRLPDDYGSPSFWEAYEAFRAGYTLQKREKVHRPSFDVTQKSKISYSVENMIRSSRTRARKAGQLFELDADWALATIEAQGFRCALTGIPFFAKNKAKCRIHPFGPSFDRINTKGGYVKSNVRIVCYAVNVMLMDWGDDSRWSSTITARTKERKINCLSPNLMEVRAVN